MNQAFIDGQNLRYGTSQVANGWNIDLMKFRIYLQRKYKVDKAYYFIGYYDNTKTNIYEMLEGFGYILVFREHNPNTLSEKKGNVDTDIVFEVMRKIAEKEKFEKVVLVSGDGDYFKMVKYLIKIGKFLRVLGPEEKCMSSLYKRRLEPKYYAFLNRPEVRVKLQR